MRASADFFRLCGTNAVHGRTFTAEDDLPNAPKTVVLAYEFWQRHFGGDPQIDRRMTLSGERYEIIGVVGPLRDFPAGSGEAMVEGDGGGSAAVLQVRRLAPVQFAPIRSKSEETGNYSRLSGEGLAWSKRADDEPCV